MTKSKVHDTHDLDTYTDSYTARQQIRLDPMLSWQIQAEKLKGSLESQHNQRRHQTIPDPLLSNRHTDDQRPEKYNSEETFETPNPKFTGFCQGQASLNTGRVAGYYCNTCNKVTFKNLPSNQNLEKESSLLNQRIQNYDQVSSPTPQYPT